MSRDMRAAVSPPAPPRTQAAPGPETARLLELARASLPGGGIWTFSHRPSGFGTILDRPDFLIERAEGAYAWTTDGRRMLDMVLGSGSVLTGHAHPEVVAAVIAQIARGSNYSHLNPPAVELAGRLVEILPCADRVRFFNSGSEAWVVALRAVRALTGRDRVLKFEGAFHGGNDATLFNTNFGDSSTWAAAPAPTPDSPGTSTGLQAGLLVAPYDDLEATQAIALRYRDELAAILVEPVARGISAGPGFLEGLRDLADELHVPLVFDEVITGFRLALGGAQEFFGVTPDLAVFGKALGSGFPIGVLAGSEQAMAPLDPGSPDGHRVVAEGSTLGNPVSATAALATLDVLSRPGTYEHLHRLGESLGAGLDEAFARRGTSIALTGVGPIIEFYVSDEPVRDYRTAMRTDMRPKAILAAGLPRHDVLGGGGRYNISLAHGDVERDLFLQTVETVLDEMA
jgi:glutamate-1-semialdehyde 2,1-aminomutase